MRIQAASKGRHGRGQDRWSVLPYSHGRVLVVADGAGGTGAGDKAAEAVIARVEAALAAHTGKLNASWAAAQLQAADLALAGDRRGGQSTAVLVVIEGAQIWGASVGDSAAWLVKPKGYLDLTEWQAQKPLLGSGRAVPRCFGPCEAHGTLLMATDGLTKYTSVSTIAATLFRAELDLNSKVQRLLNLPATRAGTLIDDVTVVLCELEHRTA